MLFKLISHAAVFAIGAGVGVYWGVHNPTQAASIAGTEQARIDQAVALAKQNVLQQVVTEQKTGTANGAQPTDLAASHMSKYQQMLQNAQQEFNVAKAKVGGQ